MRVRIKKKFTLIISSIICLVLLCGMFPCSVSASGNTLNLTAKTQWNGHMYALYETAATWAEAKVLCQTVGGHLATVTSSEEQKTIEKLLKKGSKNSYWLGGYKDSTSGWEWVTNEAFSYTNWGWNQPDGDGKALMVYKNKNGSSWGLGVWNDLNENGTCGTQAFFGMENIGIVCEWEEKCEVITELSDGWMQNTDGKYLWIENGKPAVGWKEINGKEYVFDKNGIMVTGWYKEGNGWYYLTASGEKKRGWLKEGDKWYYLYPPTGYMLSDCTFTLKGRVNSFNASGVWTGDSAPSLSYSTPAGSVKTLLNSVALNPKETASKRLNREVDAFIASFLSSDMDTYTKVKTTFDLFVNNYTYMSMMFVSTSGEMGQIWKQGGFNEYNAVAILEGGYGNCNNYSAAFAAIMRKIGLDCKVVSGQSYTTSGSSSGHVWTVITINGKEYVFDPQIEQNIALRDGKVSYYRFGVSYDSIPGRYKMADYIDFLPV